MSTPLRVLLCSMALQACGRGPDRSASDVAASSSTPASLGAIAADSLESHSPKITDDWVARFDGVGPLSAGMVLSQVTEFTGDTAHRADWSPPECDYADFPAARGISFMIFGDTVVRFDIDATLVRTSAGIGVGSAEGDVLSAYPAARVEPDPYDGPEAHYVIVDSPVDSMHRAIFQTNAKGKVIAFRVGRRRAVDLIEGCS